MLKLPYWFITQNEAHYAADLEKILHTPNRVCRHSLGNVIHQRPNVSASHTIILTTIWKKQFISNFNYTFWNLDFRTCQITLLTMCETFRGVIIPPKPSIVHNPTSLDQLCLKFVDLTNKTSRWKLRCTWQYVCTYCGCVVAIFRYFFLRSFSYMGWIRRNSWAQIGPNIFLLGSLN